MDIAMVILAGLIAFGVLDAPGAWAWSLFALTCLNIIVSIIDGARKGSR